MELVLSMYNVCPYFSLKYLGKKVLIIHGKRQDVENSEVALRYSC